MGKGSRIVRNGIVATALAAFGGGVLADTPDTPSMQVIAPIFSQLVAWQMPAGFHGDYETTRGDSYIIEAVPSGQTAQDWRQIVTITGLKGAATDTRATPADLAANIAKRFKDDCPDSYEGREMDAPVVEGHAAYAALISCGSLPPEDQLPAHSETALVVAIQGTHDFYTVQWAERGAPQDGPMRPDMATWYARLKTMQPIAVCDRVPGEQAPFPSCLAKVKKPADGAPTASIAPAAPAATEDAALTDERSAATAFVAGMHYFIGRMAATCRPILGEPESRPKALVETWMHREHNARFYEVTTQYMGHYLDVVKQREGESGMKQALDTLVGSIHRSSDAEVQHELDGDQAARVDTCRRFEANVASGQFDITSATPHYATLLALTETLRTAD